MDDKGEAFASQEPVYGKDTVTVERGDAETQGGVNQDAADMARLGKSQQLNVSLQRPVPQQMQDDAHPRSENLPCLLRIGPHFHGHVHLGRSLDVLTPSDHCSSC